MIIHPYRVAQFCRINVIRVLVLNEGNDFGPNYWELEFREVELRVRKIGDIPHLRSLPQCRKEQFSGRASAVPNLIAVWSDCSTV